MEKFGLLAATAMLAVLISPARAEVVTDWSNKTETFVVEGKLSTPRASRVSAMVQIAVFEALNSITPRYQPYRAKLNATGKENPDAAAAAAAAGIMVRVDPASADKTNAELNSYLQTLPSGLARDAGVRLGDAAATAIFLTRVQDGADAPERYQYKTAPGVYVGTAAMAVPHWSQVKPFAIQSGSAFRPAAPPKLDSHLWQTDLAEIRRFGGTASKLRSQKQSEDAKFWLTTGPQAYLQIVRSLSNSRGLKGVDAARFHALAAIASADSIIAVFDAKYHYNFWRPITAIRASNIEDDDWMPLDNTPPHPEYPCAHCISSASIAAIARAQIGSDSVPQFSATSPTAPGVTHSWTSLKAFSREVSEARIWAGFHYRFSTRVGDDMGEKIAQYVTANVMQPLKPAKAR